MAPQALKLDLKGGRQLPAAAKKLLQKAFQSCYEFHLSTIGLVLGSRPSVLSSDLSRSAGMSSISFLVNDVTIIAHVCKDRLTRSTPPKDWLANLVVDSDIQLAGYYQCFRLGSFYQRED
jgi:hypothetical protein